MATSEPVTVYWRGN